MSKTVLHPWLTVNEAGEYALVQWKVAILSTIFDLVLKDGKGAYSIEKIMNRDHPKPAGWSNRKRKDLLPFWTREEIRALLSNKALIGEHQAMKRVGGKLVHNGDPKVGFYPVAIDPDKFARVQAGAPQRKAVKGGGKSRRVSNLLTGLVRCGECGRPMRLKSGAGYFYCSAGGAGAKGHCTNTTGIQYRGRGDGLEKHLLDAVLHLALDDEVWSNRGEVARLNSTIAERERALTLATSKAERLWLAAVGDDASPMAEKLARKAEAETSELTANLAALKAQRDKAKGRVSDQEHLRRVEDLRAQIDQVPVRLKVAQALHAVIKEVRCGKEGASVWFVADSALLNFDTRGRLLGSFDLAKDTDVEQEYHPARFGEYLRRRREAKKNDGAVFRREVS